MLRRTMALVAGLLAAMLGGGLGWLTVRHDVALWEVEAHGSSPMMVVVVALAVVAGVIATFVAWRALVGPPIDQAAWTLQLPRGAAGEGGRRQVRELIDRLERLGYAIEAFATDDAATRSGPALPDAALRGASLELIERQAGEPGGRVVLRLPPVRDDGGEALGFLDAYGPVGGVYEELGTFLIAELGELLPGMLYKRMGSALDAEEAAAIRTELPERPRLTAAGARGRWQKGAGI